MVLSDAQIVELLSVAFKQMFPDLADKVEDERVKHWLANSLVGIVEYSGTLPQETRKQRDRRMECHQVYDGSIKELAAKLRDTYPNTRELSPQALILKVYNGISSIYDVLGKDEVVDHPTVNEESIKPGEVEALDSNKGVENSGTATDVEINQGSVVEPIREEPNVSVPRPNLDSDAFVSPKEEAAKSSHIEEGPHEQEVPATQIEVTEPVDVPEGKPKEEESKKLNKENGKMENSTAAELLKKAQESTQVMGGDAVAAPKSNVNVMKEDMNEAKSQIADQLENSLQARTQWTANNTVDGLIVLKKPAALRTKATVGIANKGNKKETPSQQAENKFKKFIKATSGQEISIEAWKALPDDQKYAQVIKADQSRKEDAVGATNLEKAKAVYELIERQYNSPEEQIPAFINTNKVSYAWKGVMLGGKPLNRDDLIVTVIDNSTGVIIGAGSAIEDVDNRVEFKLGQAKISANNRVTGVRAGAPRAEKKFVISIKNKDRFTADKSHIMFMLNQVQGEATASFPAAITVGGEEMGAIFQYQTNELAKNAKTKDGQPRYAKKMFSLRVSVKVDDYKKELDAQFMKDGLTPSKLDSYWNIKFAPKTQADAANPTAIEGTILQTILASYITGQTAGAAGSNVLAELDKVKKAAQAEADAEESSQLDQ